MRGWKLPFHFHGAAGADRSRGERAALRRPHHFPIRALAMVGACLMAMPAAHAEGWRLVFQDDFEETKLNSDRWATRYIYEHGTLAYLGSEAQRYADHGNHVMGNGVLSLVARPVPNKGSGGKFESGMIRSRQTFYYGYFEARVFLPDGKGVFPAFWLNPDYDADGHLEWPPEIDAFEFVIDGADSRPTMLHSSVVVKTTGLKRQGDWIYSHPRFDRKYAFFQGAEPFNRGWQTVGLLWKPDSVTAYLNGTKLWTRSYRWVTNAGQPAAPAHILFNLGIGGDWAGRNGIAVADFPQKLMIDYVKVCQFTGGGGGEKLCSGSPFTPDFGEGRYEAPGDMPRSKLVSADMSDLVVMPDGRMRLRLSVDAIATRRDRKMIATFVNDQGKVVLIQPLSAPMPTSKWRGRYDLGWSIRLPSRLKPGQYAVFFSIGGPDGQGKWANVPIAASAKFGLVDEYLRVRIGRVRISTAKS